MKHFDCLGTCNAIRPRDMRRLEALGMVESMASVVCDGDGFIIQPERRGTGWKLTNAGLAAADEPRVQP